jgi:hypothetical protein
MTPASHSHLINDLFCVSGSCSEDRDFLEERFASIDRLIQLTISPPPTTTDTSITSNNSARWETVLGSLASEKADYVRHYFPCLAASAQLSCHPAYWSLGSLVALNLAVWWMTAGMDGPQRDRQTGLLLGLLHLIMVR